MAPEAPPATYPSQPILLNIEPTLFVTDFPRSLAFFTDRLAFKVAFTHGAPAFYGQVARDAAILNLRFVHQPVIDHSKERDLLSASIWVSDAACASGSVTTPARWVMFDSSCEATATSDLELSAGISSCRWISSRLESSVVSCARSSESTKKR